MDPWPEFVAATLARHGVADLDLAVAYGISRQRFYARTTNEGWTAPAPRVRVHPSARRSVQAELLVACGATRATVAASRETAAWLHGLRPRPPRCATVVHEVATTLPDRVGITCHRARWLLPEDVVELDGVPTLTVPATLITLADRPDDDLRGILIDAVHGRHTTPEAVLDRLDSIGPVGGRGRLRGQCAWLLAHRIESRFQDDVAAELERLGYRPSRSTVRIPTADGIDANLDIALPDWQVAVEPEGDAFHRTREQRRLDRRRAAAIASTSWAVVPVDWRDWHRDREHVLASIDATIVAQQRRGIGEHAPPPDGSLRRDG